MPTLLDTHAWIWWVTRDRRLSRAASRAIDRAQAADSLWLSPISVWEVAKHVEKKRLVFDRPVATWVEDATSVPGLRLAPLTPSILVESCQLPSPFHGDPADQIIVATARDRDAAVVTKDLRLRGYSHVRSIW
jgi:PIN domain nuclease of toxin-antitoxin system